MSVHPAVSIANITKSFGKGAASSRVLNDVSVQIAPREFFTLLGPSGCGKTTLLRLVAGFDSVDTGTIAIDGADVTNVPAYRRPVNTVFQSYALFPHLSVEQNVAFALEEKGLERAKVKKRVGEALEMVRMSAFASRRPAELSGGQQQRVALARALAPRPQVLLLDEPLSALDLKLRKEMQIELKQLQAEAGICFLFVTHDQEEALTLSDRVAVMQEGRILQVGAPRVIYEAPTHRFVADFIGDINLFEGTVLGGGGVRLDAGPVLPVETTHRGRVTLAVRPERVTLVSPGSGQFDATLLHSAYMGTAMLHKLELVDGSGLLVRQSETSTAPPEAGSLVGVHIPSDALRVLER